MSNIETICVLLLILLFVFAPFISIGLSLICMDLKIKDKKKRIKRTNEQCQKCKWYGIFTCECPYYCTGETKEHFELILTEEGEKE